MFFRAVSKLTSLRTLNVPEVLWNTLLSDGDDVTEPLWRLDGVVVVECDSGAILASSHGNGKSM